MTNYPITRHDPGTLPEPPDHLGAKAAQWFWKLAAYCKVRTGIKAHTDQVEDVSRLMERYETLEGDDKEIALMNASMTLAKIGFCTADLEHLGIPVHKIFTDHRSAEHQRLERWKAKPEHLSDK